MASVHLDLKSKREPTEETRSETNPGLHQEKKKKRKLTCVIVRIKKAKTQYLLILLILSDTSERVTERRIFLKN